MSAFDPLRTFIMRRQGGYQLALDPDRLVPHALGFYAGHSELGNVAPAASLDSVVGGSKKVSLGQSRT